MITQVKYDDVMGLLNLLEVSLSEEMNMHIEEIFKGDISWVERYDLEKLTASILVKQKIFKKNVTPIEMEIVVRNILISFLEISGANYRKSEIALAKLAKSSIDAVFNMFVEVNPASRP